VIRVLQIIGSLDWGGEETTLMNYYRCIDRSKVQFDFLINTGRKNHYEDEALSLGARIFKRPMRKQNMLRNIKELFKVLKNNPEIKIVHIHSSFAFIIVDTIIAALCGIPVRIVHSHSAFSKTSFFRFTLRPFLLATATHYFCCSIKAGVSLFGKKAVKSKRFYNIKNAFALEPFRYDPEKREKLRKESNFKDSFVYLNIGRLYDVKNQEFLIDAFALALRKNLDLILLIAGEGELLETLKQKVVELDISKNVHFSGFRSDISDLLQLADTFALPSLREGMPVAVIEAQTAGLPCLVSDKVTQECKLNDLVEFLPIDKGPAIWAEHMLLFIDKKRKDTLGDVSKAGYEIKGAVRILENIYFTAMQ